MKILTMICFMLSAAGAFAQVEWRGLESGDHISGRKASEGYLRGKVVMVCRWDPADKDSQAMMRQMEDVWRSFKTKQFVLLGGTVEGADRAEAARFAEANSITFPVYGDAGLEDDEPGAGRVPYVYVVDETGKIVYRGDKGRTATQAIVMALTDIESPRTLAQWRRFLDFELEMLPGRAWLRAEQFAKKFPAEAKEYRDQIKQLKAVPDVRKLSELVSFAHKAKDMPEFSARATDKKRRFAKLIDGSMTKYRSLLESKDPRVVQEAKNALADLKWTRAAL